MARKMTTTNDQSEGPPAGWTAALQPGDVIWRIPSVGSLAPDGIARAFRAGRHVAIARGKALHAIAVEDAIGHNSPIEIDPETFAPTVSDAIDSVIASLRSEIADLARLRDAVLDFEGSI